MADFWTYLFDNDHAQRDDIEGLRADTSVTADATSRLRRQLEHLTHRVDRNELVLECVYRHLEREGSLSTAQFRELLVQIDLEDGQEDGKVSAERSRKALPCENPDCGRFINPRRDHCVYCGIPISQEAKAARKGRGRGPYRGR